MDPAVKKITGYKNDWQAIQVFYMWGTARLHFHHIPRSVQSYPNRVNKSVNIAIIHQFI